MATWWWDVKTKILTQARLVAVLVAIPLSVDARLNPKRIKQLGVEIFLQAQKVVALIHAKSWLNSLLVYQSHGPFLD